MRRVTVGMRLFVMGPEVRVVAMIARTAKQARLHRDLGTIAWVASLCKRSGAW